MFNPFAPFSKPLLDAFIKAGKTCFVRQSFVRGKDYFDDNIKHCFIFSHYAQAGHAQHHYGAISHDGYRCMYNWNDPEHQRKLTVAAGNPAGYKIYSSVFENDWQKHITRPLRQKAKVFIETKLGWKPGRNQSVTFNIYTTYGELYARLTLKGQEVRIKLEEIENVQSAVTKQTTTNQHALLFDYHNT